MRRPTLLLVLLLLLVSCAQPNGPLVAVPTATRLATRLPTSAPTDASLAVESTAVFNPPSTSTNVATDGATTAATAPLAPSPTAMATVTTTPTAASATATIAPPAANEAAATESPLTVTAVAPTLTTTATAPPTEPPAATQAPAPASSATGQVSPAVVGPSGPNVYETSISIPTYNYEAGFQPTTEEDAIFPYPRLDHGQVGGPAARSYKAIVLENGYVSVTILPELGGRVYSLRDKATGRELLYQNPVIKPTSWGYRGWWLAAGGIEWAFPVEEHGLNEWRPWTYSIGSSAYGTAVTVSDTDDRTGMEVGATISLDSVHAYVTLQPWARNNTDAPHKYQLWLNAMLAPAQNSVSGQTQFVVPGGEVIVHSSGDGGVPGSGGTMSWPVHNGRDMSIYSNWTGYLGFFVPTGGSFSGLYDHSSGQGIVRAHAPNWPSGTKFFGPATLSPSLWTDDNSNYVEMWSGATGSFWHYATLEPGQTVTWTEHWYPLHGTGGFNYANRAAALRLTTSDSDAEVAAATSSYITGTIILYADSQPVAEWPVIIGPGQAFNGSWTRAGGQSGALGLQLTAADGTVIAQTGQVP